MNLIKQKISFLITISMMLIIVLPSLVWFKFGFLFDCTIILILSVSSTLLLFSFYRLAPRVVSAFLGILALLAIVDLIFIATLHQHISSTTLSLLAETNKSELFELLTGMPAFIWLIGLLLIIAIVFSILFPFKLKNFSYSRVFLYSLVAFVLIFYYFYLYFGNMESTEREQNALHTVTDGQNYFLYSNEKKIEMLRQAFPVSLPFVLKDYYYERREIRAVFDLNKNYSFQAQRQSTSANRQVYILVIGESGRYDHWHINGYHRETSPYLSARNDIISFRSMYTYFAYSREAVPIIVSRRPVDYQKIYFDQPSIVTYFKQIGFETAWVSLQAPVGTYDSPISVNVHEADNIYFLNPADYTTAGIYDYESISTIQRLIASSDKDLFIVIHTLGSHLQYKFRYGDSLCVFTPDRKFETAVENQYSRDDQIYFVNSYDNSIIATDLFLQRLIENLEQLQTSSWMFYISDHGEGLLDDGAFKVGHGQLTYATTRLPAFFWASPQYIEEHPEKIRALQANANQTTANSMVFETLVSLSEGILPDPRPHLDMTQNELMTPPPITQLISQLCATAYEQIPSEEATRFINEECHP